MAEAALALAALEALEAPLDAPDAALPVVAAEESEPVVVALPEPEVVLPVAAAVPLLLPVVDAQPADSGYLGGEKG